MVIVKVLKRKDGAALVVGVVVALVVAQLVNNLVGDLANRISGQDVVTTDWQTQYLLPVVLAALQLIALEILIRLYVAVHNAISK